MGLMNLSIQQRALNILREFEQAQIALVGKAVILTNGIAGTVEKLLLDELHGLRVVIAGHTGDWPLSAIRLGM
jgi:hypothetical protein